MNKEILEKLDTVIASVKSNTEYQEYSYLVTKLKKHQQANQLIARVKELQKEIVKREVMRLDNTALEKELAEVVASLNRIPLYVDFLHSQEKLDIIYQLIKQRLDSYFAKKLN